MVTKETVEVKVAALAEELRRIRDEIATQENSAARLEVQIDVLKELLVEEHSTVPTYRSIGPIVENPGKKMTPALAVREFIRRNPGSTRQQIIKGIRLENLETSVADETAKRGLIATVLGQQRRRKNILRDGDQKYFPKQVEESEEDDR